MSDKFQRRCQFVACSLALQNWHGTVIYRIQWSLNDATENSFKFKAFSNTISKKVELLPNISERQSCNFSTFIHIFLNYIRVSEYLDLGAYNKIENTPKYIEIKGSQISLQMYFLFPSWFS